MTLRSWVEANLRRLGWSKAELAKRSGISRTALWKILREDSVQHHDFTIAKLERAFGSQFKGQGSIKSAPTYVPIEHEESAHVPDGKPAAATRGFIPVFRSVRGGPPMDHSAVDGVVEFTIPRALLQVEDPQAFGYIVEGSSMEPNYPSGSIVIISPRDTVANGDVCFVWFGGERGWGKTIKEVVDAGDHWHLRAQNPNYEPLVEAVPKEQICRIFPVAGVYRRTR